MNLSRPDTMSITRENIHQEPQSEEAGLKLESKSEKRIKEIRDLEVIIFTLENELLTVSRSGEREGIINNNLRQLARYQRRMGEILGAVNWGLDDGEFFLDKKTLKEKGILGNEDNDSFFSHIVLADSGDDVWIIPRVSGVLPWMEQSMRDKFNYVCDNCEGNKPEDYRIMLVKHLPIVDKATSELINHGILSIYY